MCERGENLPARVVDASESGKIRVEQQHNYWAGRLEHVESAQIERVSDTNEGEDKDTVVRGCCSERRCR